MSSTRHQDLVDRATATDEGSTFKKAHQTVGRPAVTERDIHEEYLQDPPHNEPFSHKTVDHRGRPLDPESAQGEIESKEGGILGEQGVGKQQKQTALEELTTESSVHPGNPA